MTHKQKADALAKAVRKLDNAFRSNRNGIINPKYHEEISAALADYEAAQEPDTSKTLTINLSKKKGADGKEVCYFITEHDFCGNPILNSESSALQWFDAFLENLDDGDTSEVTVKRQDMTEAEIEKIPEL